jgi:flagellar motor protein MotB
MRSLAGLGMAALVVAAALMGGCNQQRIQQLEFQNRQLIQQCETLQNELGTMKVRLLASQQAASDAATIAANAQKLLDMSAGARDAELLAAKARVAELERQIADALAAGPGHIELPAGLDKKLQEFADSFKGLVTYDPRTGMVKYNDTDLLFELGSDKVLPSAVDSLNKLAEIIRSAEAADFDVVVVGHTDTTPVAKPESVKQFQDNWGLSVRRARSVMYVLKDAGVPQPKLAIMGFGEFRPISPDKAKNRRVEIFFERANRFSPGLAESAPVPAPGPAPVGVPVP